MRSTTVSVVMLALGLPLWAQQTISCTSSNGRKQFCPADTSNGVVLVRERSDHVCQQGSTWSYSRQGISVSGGCSADFQTSGGGNTNDHPYGSSGYQNNSGDGNNNGYGAGGYGGRYGGPGGRRGIQIPAGTQLSVRLEQAVRPADVNQGEAVSTTLTDDLTVDGRVLAPAGTPVQAKVVSAHGSPLDLRLDSMRVNGQTYMLATNSVHGIRDSQSQSNADQSTKGQLGALLGGLASGGQLPSGSVFTFRLTSPAQPSGSRQQ